MQKQQSFLKDKAQLQYGGVLRNKAKNRGARPLTRKGSIHLVLRSSQAKGEWSFRSAKNGKKVTELVQRFSKAKGIQILSLANVGNHLHLHIKVPNRRVYQYWIRGLTSALVMLVIGRKGLEQLSSMKRRFWDYRPFSRIVSSLRGYLNVRDYLQINQLEGVGVSRLQAVLLIKGSRALFKDSA